MEKEFNLLDEKWIRVRLPDCSVREVSLYDALLHARQYSGLAGELPTQDMAILRLLLAVGYVVLERAGVDGQEREIEDADDALDRWSEYWEQGSFPEETLRACLEPYRERFYLFHPERPFYQVNEAGNGTEFTAAKLNGAISESSNKVRLFSFRQGAQKDVLTYPEAARWLIYLNGFDDTSAKCRDKGDGSPGAGWLGKLGLIAAQGDDLFQTLMLNLVMLDDRDEPWGKNRPVWTLDQPRTKERCEIPMPDNPAQLLTLQSRRLLLLRDERGVTGYRLLGGDFFDKVNAYAEQMTLWTHVPGKGAKPPYDQPRRHNPSRQLWREFTTIVPEDGETRVPGVVRWQSRLKGDGMLDQRTMARFTVASAQYGDKDFFVTDVFGDEIRFHLNLLTEAGRQWQKKIGDEIEWTDKVAGQAKFLGENLDKAAGGEGSAFGRWMEEQFYSRVDVPFREFLASVDPGDDALTQAQRLTQWRDEERDIVLALGREAVAQTSQTAFVGRTRTEKYKGKEETRHYSVPEAYNMFQYQIAQKLLKHE